MKRLIFEKTGRTLLFVSAMLFLLPGGIFAQRRPDDEEQMQALAFLASQADAPDGGAGDLLWALVTSAEFLTTP